MNGIGLGLCAAVALVCLLGGSSVASALLVFGLMAGAYLALDGVFRWLSPIKSNAGDKLERRSRF